MNYFNVRHGGDIMLHEPFRHIYFGYPDRIHSTTIHIAGYSQTEPNHIWGPGIRDYYLLHYIMSGTGWFQVGNEYHALRAGDLFLIYPNEVIRYGSDTSDPWQYCWVGFSGPDISSILKATDFSKSNPVMHIDDPEMPKILIDIYRHCDAVDSNYLYAVSMLTQFFSLLLRYSHQTKPISKSNYYINQAVSYMATEMADACNIQDVANYVGISSSHLYRLFMDEFSVPPIKYLTQIRIRKACTLLLENPTMSVSVIAYSVGYDDPLYFSKVFHKTMKVSPSTYRKQHYNLIDTSQAPTQVDYETDAQR